MSIRLIDTKTLRFSDENGIPEFAILSHTWQDGEMSFQEMADIGKDSNHPSRNKAGFRKIPRLVSKPSWITLKLSEAINSMYKWYQKATVCYAFLSDFDSTTEETALGDCRWFTRGWCLQELIAPKNVQFFDKHWTLFGSKAGLASQISEITRIDVQVLMDSSLTYSIPVARRMSWAATRRTTREEDIAYSLLGIFNVNIPMLYGEGSKAFMRLQDEIIKTSNDLSIFAFSTATSSRGLGFQNGPAQPYCNLFAMHPEQFKGCGSLQSTESGILSNGDFGLTNKGLHFSRVSLHVHSKISSYIMPLNCEYLDSEPKELYLRKVGPSLFAKYYEDLPPKIGKYMGPDSPRDNHTETGEAYIVTKVAQLQLERADEYAIHIWSQDELLTKGLQVLQRSITSERWDISRRQFLTAGLRSFEGYLKCFPSQRRSIQNENGNRALSGFFYLACGCEKDPSFREPKAWVRLYSTEQWRTMETDMGIVSGLGAVVYDDDNPYASDQITTGQKSGGPTVITATVKLENETGIPRFELELVFEEPKPQATASEGLQIKEEEMKKDTPEVVSTVSQPLAEKGTSSKSTSESGPNIKVPTTPNTDRRTPGRGIPPDAKKKTMLKTAAEDDEENLQSGCRHVQYKSFQS